jgi:hypothetical protein
MPPNTRGRIPGSVGAEGRTPDTFGTRRRGGRVPGALRERDRVMLAEVGRPDSGTATDAVHPGPELRLEEPSQAVRGGASLFEFNLQLIDGDTGPLPEEVVQGGLDNCPVAATLIAMAGTAVSAITSMISERPARIRSRTRGDTPDEYPRESNRLITVVFPGQRPVEVSSLLWRTGGHVAYCHSSRATGWMAYIEKAYAAWKGRNSYELLAQIGAQQRDRLSPSRAPDTREVFADLAGSWMMAHLETSTLFRDSGESSDITSTGLQRILGRAGERPTIGATRTEVTREGFRRRAVSLRNPRGGADAGFEVPFDRFEQLFAAVVQTSA